MSKEDSAYSRDTRVSWPKDGWPPELAATVDLGDGHDGWVIVADRDGFRVVPAAGRDGGPQDPPAFGTVDEAIGHQIGDPR